ncbi:hypothetical protein OG874_21530 [Nocardia sp. NBC_00565]|uniref:hypothetical protein n=1 Tax=Nocardia sp. NBC_00565 TaxID=2975993 RepID=UPI002E80AD95|nr:hypothetical protein [Nocardia sp. NBC_00565]WUC07508.1 hypothetical protein OG874_21530 [Nocardia sp. NBC_00565]
MRELSADGALHVTAACGEVYYRAWRVSAVVEPQHLLAQLREQGLLLSVVAERVLRFIPPLNLTA